MLTWHDVIRALNGLADQYDASNVHYEDKFLAFLESTQGRDRTTKKIDNLESITQKEMRRARGAPRDAVTLKEFIAFACTESIIFPPAKKRTLRPRSAHPQKRQVSPYTARPKSANASLYWSSASPPSVGAARAVRALRSPENTTERLEEYPHVAPSFN